MSRVEPGDVVTLFQGDGTLMTVEEVERDRSSREHDRVKAVWFTGDKCRSRVFLACQLLVVAGASP